MTVSQVKYSLLKNVMWKNHEYVLTEYVYWASKTEHKVKHSVTLTDNNGNTVRVPINEVEVIE